MKPLVPVLLVLAALAAVPASARTLTIGIDRSESNPFVTSGAFAQAAGAHARAEASALELGDTIRVRHFGERGEKNVRSETIRLTRALRANAVAESLSRYIAALPSKTAEPDHLTNILAFFELGSFDCTGHERIVLYTDGIEASLTMSDRAFLSGKPLPAPKADFLKGCEVVMFGIGQSKDGSLPPALSKSIATRWEQWMSAAGAKFTAIIDP